MTPLKDQKKILRGERLTARDALSESERNNYSLAICQAAFELLKDKSQKIISLFLPIRSEVNLQPLLVSLSHNGFRVCLPVVQDRETIIFREYIAGAELVDAGFGTLAPDDSMTVLDPDIMLMPLSAFDRFGGRIGYGGGYYDRVIAKLHKKQQFPELIGIAFDCQEVPSVPAESHDVPLSAVLTESGIKRNGM